MYNAYFCIYSGGSQAEILTPSGSTPRISTVRSNSSSAISFTASNVEQEENNFEGIHML